MRYAEGARKEQKTVRKLPGSRMGWVWYAITLAFRAFAWVALRAAYAVALGLRSGWGRIAAGAVAVAMLWDATWGDDGVGVPVLGNFLAFLVLGVAGIRPYKQRRNWEEHVEDVVYHAVPGHSRSQPERVRFGRHRIPNRDVPWAVNSGTFTGSWDFAFRLPAGVTREKLDLVEQHLLERLPAAHGASWRLAFDLREGLGMADLIPDIPESVALPDPPDRGREADAGTAAPKGAGYADEPPVPAPSPTLVPLGITRAGVATWDCLKLYGSILVAGAPGGGKSVALRTIVAHAFAQGWVVHLVDPKLVEFGPFRKCPRASSVSLDLEGAVGVLESLKQENTRRNKLLLDHDVQNLHEYNGLLEARGLEPLPHVLCVVDEIAELVEEEEGTKDPETRAENALKGRCKFLMGSLVQLGRAAGIHMALATQRPDATIISGKTKSNIQCRLAMGGLSEVGSEMTIESPVAARLPGISGRGHLYRSGKLEEVQIYWTSMEKARELGGYVPEGAA